MELKVTPSERIQGEDERESNYCQQKQLQEATELRDQITRAANILCLGQAFSNITK
jgi:hypothetical protein